MRCLTVAAGLLLSFCALAEDEYTRVSAAACERMKSCAMQNVDDVPPEYRDMIMQSLDSMCAYLPNSDTVPGFNAAHPMYQGAVACLRSIAESSCESLEAHDNNTPQCDEMQRRNDAMTLYE